MRLHKSRGCSVLLAYSIYRQNNVAIKFLIKNLKRKARKGGGISNMFTVDIPDEVKFLKELKHPNIVELYNDLCIRGRVLMIMEFCNNGTLETVINANQNHKSDFLTEVVARRYFRQILEAVNYMHHQDIAHRDLKCSSFLLDSRNNIKLSGFTMALKFRDLDALLCEKLPLSSYSAPELVYIGSNFENAMESYDVGCYNPKLTDIWAIGVTLCYMTTGRLPYKVTDQADDNEITLHRMDHGVQFPDDKILPLHPSLKECIKGTLQLKDTDRYSLNRMKHCHWMTLSDDAVAIGNFYKLQQPQKLGQGAKEMQLKFELGI